MPALALGKRVVDRQRRDDVFYVGCFDVFELIRGLFESLNSVGLLQTLRYRRAVDDVAAFTGKIAQIRERNIDRVGKRALVLDELDLALRLELGFGLRLELVVGVFGGSFVGR